MKQTRMQVSEAMDQISEIHEHLAKGEVYRGFRPIPVALSAVVGLFAAAVQSWIVPQGDAVAFLRYWVAVACVGAAAGSYEVAWNYIAHDDEFARRRTRQVSGQFLPCILAGVAVTLVLGRRAELIPLLPGLWAILFGLGIFSSRPYAPKVGNWVGLFYLCAGTWLLVDLPSEFALSGWRVGAVFGIGQVAIAIGVYVSGSRRYDDNE
jgi:hypothetical protein